MTVDTNESLTYAAKYLSKCYRMGVDLEGKLSSEGYIDLIQISGVKLSQDDTIAHKQIFIFDIWGTNQRRKGLLK